eukprot:534101_1
MLRSMVSPMFLAASLLLCVDASYFSGIQKFVKYSSSEPRVTRGSDGHHFNVYHNSGESELKIYMEGRHGTPGTYQISFVTKSGELENFGEIHTSSLGKHDEFNLDSAYLKGNEALRISFWSEHKQKLWVDTISIADEEYANSRDSDYSRISEHYDLEEKAGVHITTPGLNVEESYDDQKSSDDHDSDEKSDILITPTGDGTERNEEENNYDTAYMPYREKAAYGFIRNEYNGYYPDDVKTMVARFTDYPDGAFIAETKQCTVRWVTPHSYDTARQEWVNSSRDGAIEIKLNDTVSTDVARFAVSFGSRSTWYDTFRGGIFNRTIMIPKVWYETRDSKWRAYDRLKITVSGEHYEKDLDIVHIPKGVPISRSTDSFRVTWESGPHSRIDIFVNNSDNVDYSRVMVVFINGGRPAGEWVECSAIENSNDQKCRIEKKDMNDVGNYDKIVVLLEIDSVAGSYAHRGDVILPKEVIEKAGR